MFGRDRKTGRARVIARQPHGGRVFALAGDPGRLKFDYVVDVTPSDGSLPFRATFTAAFGGDEWELVPEVGHVVSVTFRGDGTRVRLDGRELAERQKAAAQAAGREFEEAASGGPSDPPTRT